MTIEESVKKVEQALGRIISLEDIDTVDEQFDSIRALARLRTKLKDKEKQTEVTK